MGVGQVGFRGGERPDAVDIQGLRYQLRLLKQVGPQLAVGPRQQKPGEKRCADQRRNADHPQAALLSRPCRLHVFHETIPP